MYRKRMKHESSSSKKKLLSDAIRVIRNWLKSVLFFLLSEHDTFASSAAPKNDPASQDPHIRGLSSHLLPDNFRSRRNSLQRDGELPAPCSLRARSGSPHFWKLTPDATPPVDGPRTSSDCRSFWKRMEKCSMEDLSARRRTPSPVRPASVAAGFYPPKTAEALHSPKKKVTRWRCRIVGFACLTYPTYVLVPCTHRWLSVMCCWRETFCKWNYQTCRRGRESMKSSTKYTTVPVVTMNSEWLVLTDTIQMCCFWLLFEFSKLISLFSVWRIYQKYGYNPS